MRSVGEVVAGLLGRGDRAWVGFEEYHGPEADTLRRLQRLGFVAADPLVHPATTCLHCGDGTPCRLGPRFFCSACRSDIDPQAVLVWPVRTDRFFEWLAAELKLTGRCQQLDQTTWQLGTRVADGRRTECFFRDAEPVSELFRQRIGAYQNVLILTGRETASPANRSPEVTLPLADIIRDAEEIGVHGLEELLRPRGNVRFEPHSGAVWLGTTWLGEVPVGSKEFHFLDRSCARPSAPTRRRRRPLVSDSRAGSRSSGWPKSTRSWRRRTRATGIDSGGTQSCSVAQAILWPCSACLRQIGRFTISPRQIAARRGAAKSLGSSILPTIRRIRGDPVNSHA